MKFKKGDKVTTKLHKIKGTIYSITEYPDKETIIYIQDHFQELLGGVTPLKISDVQLDVPQSIEFILEED